jgi:DNA repair exonuclease SbcCD nuclease subunit
MGRLRHRTIPDFVEHLVLVSLLVVAFVTLIRDETKSLRFPSLPSSALEGTSIPQLAFHQDPGTSPLLDKTHPYTTPPHPHRVFRILQLTDLHLGENAWEEWGPEQDRKTYQALSRIFIHEHPNTIDLVVLSGDQLTANNVDANATAYYQKLAFFFEQRSIPFAVIFGNHDDAPLERRHADGTVTIIPSMTSRQQLLQSLQSFSCSLTQSGPSSVPGVSNYVLNVFRDSSAATEGKELSPTLRLVFMDTGGGTLNQTLTKAHQHWFRNQVDLFVNVPHVIFQHIPTAEFQFFSPGFEVPSSHATDSAVACRGLHEDGIAPVTTDFGWLPYLYGSRLPVSLVAVGHNHGNDYCCPYPAKSSRDGLHLCFGRHSGYGGYGSWERGARVYEFSLPVNATSSYNHTFPDILSSLRWKTWVRLESGSMVNEYEPAW